MANVEIRIMLKQATLAAAVATLMIGSVSIAQAGADTNDRSDYQGGSLFGPSPRQIFSYHGPGFGFAPYGYGAGGAYGYAYPYRGGRTPSLRGQFPTAPWEEY
jgi:hypothetical protein